MIHSRKALMEYVGFSEETIKRWIKLYYFPKPQLVSKSRRHGVFWNKDEVDHWISENQDLVTDMHRSAIRRSGDY